MVAALDSEVGSMASSTNDDNTRGAMIEISHQLPDGGRKQQLALTSQRLGLEDDLTASLEPVPEFLEPLPPPLLPLLPTDFSFFSRGPACLCRCENVRPSIKNQCRCHLKGEADDGMRTTPQQSRLGSFHFEISGDEEEEGLEVMNVSAVPVGSSSVLGQRGNGWVHLYTEQMGEIEGMNENNDDIDEDFAMEDEEMNGRDWTPLYRCRERSHMFIEEVEDNEEKDSVGGVGDDERGDDSRMEDDDGYEWAPLYRCQARTW